MDCNEQLAKMLGYTVAEMKGMEIAHFIVPEDRDRIMASILQGRESITEHAMLRKDGTRMIVETHGRPVLPSRSSRRLTAIRDITGRMQAEEALRRASNSLPATAATLFCSSGAMTGVCWRQMPPRSRPTDVAARNSCRSRSMTCEPLTRGTRYSSRSPSPAHRASCLRLCTGARTAAPSRSK